MRTDAAPSLRDDRRGAILVVAVFMSVFLVGCLWYLVGVGDAAIYREKMQDGSDATAFASAVYHARGMNIIAMLNLIMAAMLAVLIAFKVAFILATTIAVIAGVLCPWTSWTCPIAGAATDIAANLQANVIPSVQNIVNTVLQACSESQRWVAKIAPWIGAGRSVVAANAYAPTVKGGAAVSISMTPDATRLGLPVQEEPFDKLCTRAGAMLGDLAFGWIPGLSLAGGLFGKLVGTFPGTFCGGSGGVTAADQTQNIKDQCAQAEQAYDQANKNNPGAKPFDMKKCQSDAEKKLQQAGPSGGGGSLGSMQGKTSKMVYSGAWNGNDYFQVYGFVIGDNAKMHQNAQSRVEMAGWGKAKVSPNPLSDTLEKAGFAQAEFYYDQVTPGRLAWSDYESDAMWNMRWRARLRRFRPPQSFGMGSVVGAMTSIPGLSSSLGLGFVDDVVNGVAGSAIIH